MEKTSRGSTGADDQVALLLLNKVSLQPAARRDYELRSSSPATSSSQLVSRAFQNARAMSFNAASGALHHKDVVPFVLHPAPNQRVFFSGPLTSSGSGHGHGHGMPPAPAPAPAPVPHPGIVVRHGSSSSVDVDYDLQSALVVSDSSSSRIVDAPPTGSSSGQSSQDAQPRFDRAVSGVIERASTRIPAPPRRAQSGDLRASKASTTVVSNSRTTRSSELMRGSSWRPSEDGGREQQQQHGGREPKMEEKKGGESKVEEKRRGESRRRPTASIAWDTLNDGSQGNSPQHELAAIPFQWEEAPGKPLSDVVRVREVSGGSTTAKVTSARGDQGAPERAQSHRFYSRASSQCEQLPRKSSFDAASASAHLISEVVSSIDLVAPAAAKFLVENSCWVSPAAAPEAHVAVPFQWEEAPGVPKLDADAEVAGNSGSQEMAKPVSTVPVLQLPPRLSSPASAASGLSKEELRGRLRTRSMSGPLAGYYPHTSPARRRQLQHSPARRSSSPSKRSISPSRIAQHFTSSISHRKRQQETPPPPPPHTSLTASLEAELRVDDTSNNVPLGLGRSVSGVLLSEYHGRAGSPHRFANRSVSPSRRIQALAKQLTCKIRPVPAPPNSKPQITTFPRTTHTLDPWSPTSMNLSGPSSSNSDLDASGQTPVSEVAFSKSFSRVSYESFRSHSFGHRAAAAATSTHSPADVDDVLALAEVAAVANSDPPGSPYLGPTEEDRRGYGSVSAAEVGVKAVVKMCRTGSSALLRKKSSRHPQPDMWAPTLASYFRCLEAATLISNSARAAAITGSGQQQSECHQQQEREAAGVAPHTRLPYTMPATSSEQNLLWKEYCESPNQTEFRTPCLGVKLPSPKFIHSSSTRGAAGGKKQSSSSERNSWSSIPTSSTEDGYRSPAYAATLELLSPSADLFRKKHRRTVLVGSSASDRRGIKLVTRRRTQIMEAVCQSLKRAIYKCARRCCRKASSPPPLSNVSQTKYIA